MTRLWWWLRFVWCAFLQLDFENGRVQDLVSEHWRRWGTFG